MKFGAGFVLMWIQCIVLSTAATIEAEAAGWSALAVTGAWLAGLIVGMFPIIRTLALFGMLLLNLPWWQAAGYTLIAAAVLCMIEGFGKTLIMTSNRST